MKLNVLSVLAGAAIGLLAISAPLEASAQGRTRRPPPQAQVQDMSREILQREGSPCQYSASRILGRNQDDNILYEVSCHNGPGLLLLDTEPAQIVNCIANNASVARRRAENPEAEVGAECILEGNTDVVAAVSPLAVAAGVTCAVDQARWVGLTPEGSQRYEVSCPGTDGYWFDVNASNQSGNLLPCLLVMNAGGDCELTTPAEQAAWVMNLAAASGRSCQASAARYVGSIDTGQRYYEVGCSDSLGFMVRTTADGGYDSTIDCASATHIDDGCTLTGGAAIAAAASEQWRTKLANAGISCDFVSNLEPRREMSGERRDVVEFQCNDRPWGLVAFLPTDTGSAEQIDCLTAQARLGDCTLTTRQMLTEQLNSLMSRRRNASCNVTDFRVYGRLSAAEAESANQVGDVVELSCAGREGYIVVVTSDRSAISAAQTCSTSAQRGGARCELGS